MLLHTQDFKKYYFYIMLNLHLNSHSVVEEKTEATAKNTNKTKEIKTHIIKKKPLVKKKPIMKIVKKIPSSLSPSPVNPVMSQARLTEVLKENATVQPEEWKKIITHLNETVTRSQQQIMELKSINEQQNNEISKLLEANHNLTKDYNENVNVIKNLENVIKNLELANQKLMEQNKILQEQNKNNNESKKALNQYAKNLEEELIMVKKQYVTTVALNQKLEIEMEKLYTLLIKFRQWIISLETALQY